MGAGQIKSGSVPVDSGLQRPCGSIRLAAEQAWCWQHSLELMPAGSVEFGEFT